MISNKHHLERVLNSMEESDIKFECISIEQIDLEIGKIVTDMDEVDDFIRRLTERKAKLVEKFENLKNEKVLRKSLHLANQNWESESFPWTPNIKHTLKSVFKLEEFRSQQQKTINAVLSKNDVLLLAPTGGGKSLCFQLPAVISNGITIVVSPLISLMEDQIWALKKLDVKAELLCSSTDKNDVTRIYRILSEKSDNHKAYLSLLYITPERMAASKRFMTALQKCYFNRKLDMFAIDEVHCCSQWGHDFRPDYKFLGSLKTMFPDIPILGVTATATTKVIVDVQKMLNIRECLVLKAPFNRPNLYYQVMEKPSSKENATKFLSRLLKNRYAGMSGIIYTFSIKDAEELSADLRQLGIEVRPYHASLDAERRTKIHTQWMKGEIQAVIATVAFGMGIDKPDVRFVIHHTMSKSMENFYQESGRAGRDGKYAECILMYRFADMPKITGMMFTEQTGLKNAYLMVSYCINGTSCRRDIISKHFTEVWKESDCNEMCDRCVHKNKIMPPEIDLKKYYQDLCCIIQHAAKMDIKLTGLKLIDSWYGKGAANLRLSETKPPAVDRQFAEQILAYLIIENYLKEDFHFTPYSTISYIKQGVRKLEKNAKILFNGARVYDLPDRRIFNTVDNDVEIISDESPNKSKGTAYKSNRKRASEGSSHSSTADILRTPKKKNRSLSLSSSSTNEESHNNTTGKSSSSTNGKSHNKREKSSSTKDKSHTKLGRKSSSSTTRSAQKLAEDSIQQISTRVTEIVTEVIKQQQSKIATQEQQRESSDSESEESENDDIAMILQPNDIIVIED